MPYKLGTKVSYHVGPNTIEGTITGVHSATAGASLSNTLPVWLAAMSNLILRPPLPADED
jgi:hypothetical protein